MKLIHGGDWAGFQREYGRLPLDFSANVSPLGLPEGVRQAVVQALSSAERYPDPLCRELRERLAKKHGLAPELILCGNGASDLIDRFVLAVRPHTALVPVPAFAEYARALELSGCQVRPVFLRQEENFAVTEEVLELISQEIDVLFLCEPSNPAGRTTDRTLLQAILEKCAACGTLLVVDECFNEFLDEPEAHSLTGELVHYPDLLILKAFTKWYAMAGIRLGYALCGDAELLKRMSVCGQPWAVSSLAQAAGAAALEESEYSGKLRLLIQTERPRMAAGLSALGCQVCPGEANYLLFQCWDHDLAAKLMGKGILIRDCENYPGLGPGWYRVAVRTEQENLALLRAMGEVI